MEDFQFTTIFSSTLKALVSEEKDKYLAMASHLDIGKFIPDIDTQKNVDLLPVSFDAFVANRVNKNGDVVDTATTVAMIENFKNKPINIEHNRQRVVGTILTAGYSEFGTSKPLTEEEVKELNGPFNVALGGVIWKVVSEDLADKIEEASDPTSEKYQEVSASWELGFNDYNLVLLAEDEKNIEAGEVVTSVTEIDTLKSSLRAFGGSGRLEDGRGVYRQVVGSVLPLGIGLTQTPAADVKGVTIADDKEAHEKLDDEEDTQDAENLKEENKKEKQVHYKDAVKEDKKEIKKLKKDQKIDQKSEEKISHSEVKNVTIIKDSKIMEKIKSLEDITDETPASVVSDFIEDEMKKASEKFSAAQTEVEDALKASKEDNEALTTKHSELETKLGEVTAELDKLKEENIARESQEKFNQRMAAFDEDFELDDEDRQVIAADIKDMSDEDYEAYATKMGVLLRAKRNKYGGNKGDIPDADRKKEGHHGKGPKRKETADEEGEKDFAKSSETAVASEAAEVVEEVMSSVEEETPELPTTTTPQERSVQEKFQNAFSLDQFDIKL
jgi:hypothetical protein